MYVFWGCQCFRHNVSGNVAFFVGSIKFRPRCCVWLGAVKYPRSSQSATPITVCVIVEVVRTILTLVVRLSVKSSALDVEVSVKVRLRNACTADSQAYITRIVAGVGLAHAGGALEREGTRSIFRVRLAHTVCVVLPRAARSTFFARTNIASLAFTVVIARVVYLIATRITVRVAVTVARVIATAIVWAA